MRPLTRIVAFVIAALSCVVTSVPAHAALVTWHLTGTVNSVAAHATELNSLGVFAGTPFEASITYQSTTPASNPSDPPYPGCCGHYVDAVVALSFDAAAYSVDISLPITSQFDAWYGANQIWIDALGSAGPSLLAPGFYLEFYDTWSPNGLSLPTEPPLYSGTQRWLALYADTNRLAPAITAYNFEITYTVPEAASGTLLLVAGAFLSLRLARRARSLARQVALARDLGGAQ